MNGRAARTCFDGHTFGHGPLGDGDRLPDRIRPRGAESVHDECAFTPAHFDRWLSLFHDTVELGWTGPNAERALLLAENVARVHSRELIGEAAPTSW